MAEWLKVLAWKASESKGSAGSNPVLSAMIELIRDGRLAMQHAVNVSHGGSNPSLGAMKMNARVAKLVYALDLGSSVFGRAGSTPASRTRELSMQGWRNW